MNNIISSFTTPVKTLYNLTFYSPGGLIKSQKQESIQPPKKVKPKEIPQIFAGLLKSGKYREAAELWVPSVFISGLITGFKTWLNIWDLYWIFAFLRIVLVFFPQNGYIHPDEFFQNVEVLSGDVFNIEVHRAWEFNKTNPLRSMTLPLLTTATPLLGLKMVNRFTYQYLNFRLISSYMLVVLPRLVMTMLSFIVDYCVYQICILYRHNYNQCLVTLASSYVMLTYATRTFSNTIELVLTSLLIFLVCHCMQRTAETMYINTVLQEQYEAVDNVKEKVIIHRKKRLIPGHDFKFFFPISIILAIGFFNRPTFLFFAFVPLFFWFQRGFTINSQVKVHHFHLRMLSLVPGFVFTSCFFVLVDSLYYGDLTWNKLYDLSMHYEDWKITPLNFLTYNIIPDNIAQHGHHSRYHHALINIPLLFGPLGLFGFYTFIKFISNIFLQKWMMKPGLLTVNSMMNFSFIMPIVFLSFFCHQEPRFLIPILLPLILTNSQKLRYIVFGKKYFLKAWYCFNLTMVIFYGFLHQGGLVSSVAFLGRQVPFHPNCSIGNLVFGHTYMPPKFLLLQQTEEFDGKFAESENAFQKSHISLTVHDFAGLQMQNLTTEIISIATKALFKEKHIKKPIENFLIIPGSVQGDLINFLSQDVNISFVRAFYPHVSMENLPSFQKEFDLWDTSGYITPISILKAFYNKLLEFSLHIYKFDVKTPVS